jgi:phytoene dehydrogenase-like protein
LSVTVAPLAAADYVIVGSGINALVAAALLSRKRHKVQVLERNDRLGGCLLTDETITAPGFIHDVMATTFVLFITSPAYAELGHELEQRGLAFAHTRTPTAVLLPDGRHAVLAMERSTNIASFDRFAPGDGRAYATDMERLGADAPLLFALLGGPLWSGAMVRLLVQEAWRRGLRGLATFFGEALGSSRGWLESRYQSDLVRALFAPWVLHAGLGPESACSGQIAKVIAFALEAAGTPIVEGGARNALNAFERLIRDQGSEIITGADAERVLLDRRGAARGVRLVNGQEIPARKGVICSVTPNQLYGRLLADATLPPEVATAVAQYRYGKGNMQIHYALNAPPRWKAPDLGAVGLLHLTPGLDAVSKAVNEAERGMLPAIPTICVGQPAALDPTRCPQGHSILWLQLAEAPRCVKGDAAGELNVPEQGQWTEALREAFADRIEALLARHIDGFSDSVIARRAYSPSDLERLNVNLVGGDPYGGFCGLDQFFLWRPFRTSVNHRTVIPGLYHIGASTHPGPGLGAGSGYLVAKALG